ncbi:MAG: PAS domain S-box protein [Nitrospirota bacterium]
MTISGSVLVVDDETDTLNAICAFLKKFGYDAVGVASGKDALELLKHQKFNLLLADLIMPKINGIELIKAATKTGPHLVCIMISGKGTLPDAVEAMKAGAFDFITKPIDFMILKVVIERAIEVQRIKEEEERYRTILTEIQNCFFSTDIKGTITFVNKSLLKMFGYDGPGEIIGRHFREFVHSEMRDRIWKEFEKAIDTRIFPENIKLAAIKKDGSKFYIEVQARPFYEGERISGVACVINDVTEKKQLEDKAVEVANKLQTIFNSINDGLAIMDKDLIVKQVNRYRLEALGLKEEQVIGKNCYKVFQHCDKPCEICSAQPVFEKGEAVRVEKKAVLRDGTIKYFDSQGTPIFDNNGNVVQVISSVRDITERKEAEENLKNSRDQLRNLYSRLQTIREEERVLLSREIHDELGQLLTGLKIQCRILFNGIKPEKNEVAAHIDSISQLLDKAIDTVQKISRELRPAILDDLGLLAAIRWQAEEFENRTHIKCEVTMEREEEIKIDRKTSINLFRILQETLTNIARHARATKVNIILKEKPDRINLIIEDNGIGITEQQIANPRSLGLLGIKERIQFLGGTFSIQGIHGKGTTVEVSVPR